MAEIRLSRIKSSTFKISSYAGPSVHVHVFQFEHSTAIKTQQLHVFQFDQFNVQTLYCY